MQTDGAEPHGLTWGSQRSQSPCCSFQRLSRFLQVQPCTQCCGSGGGAAEWESLMTACESCPGTAQLLTSHRRFSPLNECCCCRQRQANTAPCPKEHPDCLALCTAGRTEPSPHTAQSSCLCQHHQPFLNRSKAGKAAGLKAEQTEKGSQQPWDGHTRQKSLKWRGLDRAKAD